MTVPGALRKHMGKFTAFHTFVYRARAFVSAFTAPELADHKKPEVERVLWWGVSPGQAILASRPILPVVACVDHEVGNKTVRDRAQIAGQKNFIVDQCK